MTAGDADLPLLERWRQGDGDAGRALFERHFAAVSRFFQSKVSLASDDLIQETFLALVEGQHRFAGTSTFRAYLFGIAHNVLRGHIRAKLREPVDLTRTLADDLGPTATGALALDQRQQRIIDALRRIPLEFQIVLELYYWEQMTGAEIAEVLGIPDATVRSRMRRGRKLLARRLAQSDGSFTVV